MNTSMTEYLLDQYIYRYAILEDVNSPTTAVVALRCYCHKHHHWQVNLGVRKDCFCLHALCLMLLG